MDMTEAANYLLTNADLDNFRMDIVLKRGIPAVIGAYDGDIGAIAGPVLDSLAKLARQLDEHSVLPVFRDRLPTALRNYGTALDLERIEAVCNRLAAVAAAARLLELPNQRIGSLEHVPSR